MASSINPSTPVDSSTPADPSTPAKAAAAAAPDDPSAEERDVSGAADLFGALLAQLAAHRPSPEAEGQWRAMIQDEEARRDGVNVTSDRVIAAAMSGFAAVVPHLLQAPLPGYGPRRACYAVGVALGHARAYAAFLETEARRAAASGQRSVGVKEARRERLRLRGLLMEATEADAALQAAVVKASRKGGRTVAQLSASLQGLSAVAWELIDRAAAQPGLLEVLEDMGLSEDAVRRAEDAGRALGAARSAHDAQRTALREESDELNTFDGRVWFELEALRRAVDRARVEGRKIPAMQLTALGPSPRRRAAASTPAPAPASVSTPAQG